MNSIIELDTLVSNLENSNRGYSVWRLEEGESIIAANARDVCDNGVIIANFSNGTAAEVVTTRITSDLFVGIVPPDPVQPQHKRIAIFIERDFSQLPDTPNYYMLPNKFNDGGVWSFDRKDLSKNAEIANSAGFKIFYYILTRDKQDILTTDEINEQSSSSDPEVGRKMIFDRAINDLELDVATLKVTNNIAVIADLLERINRSTKVINSYYEDDIDDYIRDNDRGRGRSRNRR